jgi:uracil-DNA glycosylase
MSVKIETLWAEKLKDEFTLPYFKYLTTTIREKYLNGEAIFPPAPLIFNAFSLCPFDQVKVVLLGQDPYHGTGEAHGLCFSVPNGVRIPPSLKNIFKEIETDLQVQVSPMTGNLESWARQGILLLNATLTVAKDSPGSHQGLGWETFTDAVIKKLSQEKSGIVFLLWGKFAGTKSSLIDESKHLILKAPHPSPFSVHTGFFGCRHFSQTNSYLKSKGLTPINWT